MERQARRGRFAAPVLGGLLVGLWLLPTGQKHDAPTSDPVAHHPTLIAAVWEYAQHEASRGLGTARDLLDVIAQRPTTTMVMLGN